MVIAASLESTQKTPDERIFYGYFVHDVNVACLMRSLKLVPDDESLTPAFTSSLIIEWYRDKSNASSIGAKVGTQESRLNYKFYRATLRYNLPRL